MNKEIIFHKKKIHYKVFGNGNPLVLIHGFGEDGNIWRNQIDFLKNKFKLIIPNLPGSGQSEMIEDMSMEGMAEAIKAILNNEYREQLVYQNTFKVSMFGHSMGGYITLAFAEKFPESLSAFGLFHSTAFADSEEKKELRNKGIDFVKKYGSTEFLKTTLPNLFSAYTQKENLGIISTQLLSINKFSQEAIINYYKAMIKRPDRTAVLKHAKVPILIIAGNNDQTILLNDSLRQCHLSDISYFHILQKSAHMGMLEEAELSNQILEGFLLRNTN